MAGSYYVLKSREQTDDGVVAIYDCTIHAQGAWNPNEQHMAPVAGVICAELDAFSPRDDVRIARISFDIFGLIHFGEFSITTKTIRAGRTIELIESVMQTQGKTCVVARAWRLQTSDTKVVAGLENTAITPPDDMPDWDGMAAWPGGYIRSIRAKTDINRRAGKGVVWLTNELDMAHDSSGQALPVSDFVRLMGMVDTANGIVPRATPDKGKWAFPNVDLQIHLLRIPKGRWLGLETIQQIGDDGIGLTSSVLHDEQGVFGHSEQILTVRQLD
ncbi:thioesterase [Moraxella caviae]|uniref:Thioesterase n=1 Tax=Moraxella caviae TaxID=34060 RepID=A0A1T0A8F9_9GAMM|nr:thioesterase family protein [Moraxella caviae]OOR91899.1 thioesterase [Moraxella caviae]STZ09753.1 Uncharacterised protein [Moraxella caviae]